MLAITIALWLKGTILLYSSYFFFFSDTVKFDNSYSLTKSKSLDYWMEVLEPLYDNEEVGYQEPLRFDYSKE